MTTRHISKSVRDVSLGAGDVDVYANIQSANLTVKPSGGGTDWSYRGGTIQLTIHKASDDADITVGLSRETFELMSEDAIAYLMRKPDSVLRGEGITLAPY